VGIGEKVFLVRGQRSCSVGHDQMSLAEAYISTVWRRDSLDLLLLARIEYTVHCTTRTLMFLLVWCTHLLNNVAILITVLLSCS